MLGPTKPIRYKLVCEQNVFCYLDFRSYLKANYSKSLPFALKRTLAFEIHWVMLSLLRCLSLPSPSSLLALTDFKSAFSLQRFFGVKTSPARIYSRLLNSAFLCLLFCSICIRNRLRFTDSKHCFADDEWTSQLFMNTLVIDGKSLSVKCYMLPRNKKCAVTSNYCMTLWRTPSDWWALRVQLTRNHARFTHCVRRDYKLTSLGVSRGINLAFASGHFARNYWIHSRGLSWTHHNGSLPFIWVTTVLKRRS